MLLSQTQLKTAEVPTRRQLDQSRTGDLETLRGGEPFASLQQTNQIECHTTHSEGTSPHNEEYPPQDAIHKDLVRSHVASNNF